MHINTSHGLHSHYMSSFQTDFLQADTEVEIKKNRRERSSVKHMLFWQMIHFPPQKMGCKNSA